MVAKYRRDEDRIPKGGAIALVIQDLERNRLAMLHRLPQIGHRAAICVGPLQEPAVAPDNLAFLIARQV